MLLTTLYFVLALLVLVIVHEYGHFQVARWCGVKVLRFSFGFGKVLFRWHDKQGTQYAWSLFPLGGYVKMLGESNEAVAEHDQHMAFNHQSIWARIAIVLAGPLFNLIFAFFALWLVLVLGLYSLAPIIQSVQPNSIAAKAGIQSNQEVIGLNASAINSWKGFQYAIMPYIGSQESVDLRLKSLENGHISEVTMPLAGWRLDSKKPNLLTSLGIEPFIPAQLPIIGEIIPNSPAATAGLQVGDRILRVDGKTVSDWLDLVNTVKAHPDYLLSLQIQRDDQQKMISVMTQAQKKQGKLEGFLGLRPQQVDWPEHWVRLEREAWIPAAFTALKQTWDLSTGTLILMGRLATGKLSLKNISGPLGIAQGAGTSGRNGFTAYLFFLALVSISLAVLNLLPIPMLDGGHLLFFIMEIIIKRPLNERIKSIGVYFGMVLLASLMFIALSNDLLRLIE